MQSKEHIVNLIYQVVSCYDDHKLRCVRSNADVSSLPLRLQQHDAVLHLLHLFISLFRPATLLLARLRTHVLQLTDCFGARFRIHVLICLLVSLLNVVSSNSWIP